MRSRIFMSFVFMLLLSILTNCGDSTGPSEASVGPDGGTVSGKGVAITFPSGALESSTDVTFDDWNGAPSLPTGFTSLESGVKVGPANLTLGARTNLSYDISSCSGSQDIDELAVYCYDEANQGWFWIGSDPSSDDNAIGGIIPFLGNIKPVQIDSDLLDTDNPNSPNESIYDFTVIVHSSDGLVEDALVEVGLAPCPDGHSGIQYVPAGENISASGYDYTGRPESEGWLADQSFYTNSSGEATCKIVLRDGSFTGYWIKISKDGAENWIAYLFWPVSSMSMNDSYWSVWLLGSTWGSGGGSGNPELPTPSTLYVEFAGQTDSTGNGYCATRLSWTECPDDDFEKYVLYRSYTPDITSDTSIVSPMTVILDQSLTEYYDFAVTWETPYYYVMRTKDTQGYSSWSNEVEITTPPEGGNNPPNPPSYPYPSDGATGKECDVELSWWCSDPDGDELTYDVYFGTTSSPQLVASDISSRSYVPGTLECNTKYYWQIVAEDIHGAETPGPVWNFTTEDYSGPVLWCVNTNLSGTDYIFKIDPNTGSILTSFNSPGPLPQGLTWDGNCLWNCDRETDLLYRIDPISGTVLQSFDISGLGSSPEGLTWDGNQLWHVNSTSIYIDIAYLIDPNTGIATNSFDLPSDHITGLTWDGTYLWCADFVEDVLYRIDPYTGSILDSIPSPGGQPKGLAWDGTYLWISNTSDDTIYQINSNNGAVVGSITAPGDYVYGITWQP